MMNERYYILYFSKIVKKLKQKIIQFFFNFNKKTKNNLLMHLLFFIKYPHTK